MKTQGLPHEIKVVRQPLLSNQSEKKWLFEEVYYRANKDTARTYLPDQKEEMRR